MASEKRSGDSTGKAAETAGEAQARKEKMLHARIPENLDREIKRRAGNLGLSGSTVVRHVLLNTFNLVEDIVTDSTGIARSISGDDASPADSGRAPRDGNDPGSNDVIGWQEAILNLNAVCDRCNAILAAGKKAAIGIRETAGPRTIICLECLAKQLKTATRSNESAAE
jgi:hypothetical protein